MGEGGIWEVLWEVWGGEEVKRESIVLNKHVLCIRIILKINYLSLFY